jgi:hypothetical protein
MGQSYKKKKKSTTNIAVSGFNTTVRTVLLLDN